MRKAPDDSNKWIYEHCYSNKNYQHRPKTAYDRYMLDLRFGLVEKYGSGKDVLDLCCGTGSFLIPLIDKVKSMTGLDFSAPALKELEDQLSPEQLQHVQLVEADARATPLADDSFDCIYSYSSLYTIPDVDRVFQEVFRLLRPGGVAILDMGNSRSINRFISTTQHRRKLWARPYLMPLGQMRKLLADTGFIPVERRVFQLLPMYGCPKPLFFLWPLCHPAWKRVMGIRVGDRILDEMVSGSPLLDSLAFRHIFVVRKPE